MTKFEKYCKVYTDLPILFQNNLSMVVLEIDWFIFLFTWPWPFWTWIATLFWWNERKRALKVYNCSQNGASQSFDRNTYILLSVYTVTHTVQITLYLMQLQLINTERSKRWAKPPYWHFVFKVFVRLLIDWY